MAGKSRTFITVGSAIETALGKTVGAANQLPTEIQDVALVREIHLANREFHRKGAKMMKKRFPWMLDYDNIQTYAPTTLAADLAEGGASATLASGTGFPTGGGSFWSQKAQQAIDFIDYGSRSGVVLSTVSDVGFDHDSGSHAELLYALPSNFQKMIEMFEDRNPMTYKDTGPLIVPERPFFTYIGNYIWLNKDFGSHVLTLRFWAEPTRLSNGTDTVVADKALKTNVDEDYQMYLVWHLVAHIEYIKRRMDKMKEAMAFKQAALQDAVDEEISAVNDPFETIGPSW